MPKYAARTFTLTPQVGSTSFNLTDAKIEDVREGLDTTISLFQDGNELVCLISSHFITHTRLIYEKVKQIALDLIGTNKVLLMSSHNHCAIPLSNEASKAFWGTEMDPDAFEWTETGEAFFNSIKDTLPSLVTEMREVEIHYGCASESRITFNRKGRRMSGTYMIREEDRLELGADFQGDIDTDAPVIVFRDKENHKNIGAIAQYNGHPATAYHPERPMVHGEFPQRACRVLSKHLGQGEEIPVAFLQGCAGNINSIGMMTGSAKLAEEQGDMLAETFIRACESLKVSESKRVEHLCEIGHLPLKPLPSYEKVCEEISIMEDFISRADEGDENTLSCVGLNFGKTLSPKYRGRLVDFPLDWAHWAKSMHEKELLHTVPKSIPTEIHILRLGDVAIAGWNGEIFMEVGRKLKQESPMPLTITCGYTNISVGYVPNSDGVDDQEYMSSFYRYSKYYPPYAKPGGDLLATQSLAMIESLIPELAKT